jgi:uncharacterized low-complexity protein
MNQQQKVKAALGGLMLSALAGLSGTAQAFQATELSAGYQQTPDGAAQQAADPKPAEKAKEGKCGEGKCGEGKCGGDKKAAAGTEKAKEGKCGEGKCGGDKKAATDKAKEGKCGGMN